ncbi:MAG: ribosomal L7Ae/L30e/S12e/Gadd45 family protein [Eubacterium sp.]|nr:ribosomal L7Ae/L30e/S12e/Gadd45 family protein [Eubacterium sp.]MBQ8981505.1 ribosomal L7Ae/L30e/S12e/Gadd45 family protein [Eubacterium sp.]
MNSKKYISLLGMARRAGKLSMGHDMALGAVKGGKAKLVVFASDISPRLIKEFEFAVSNVKKPIECIQIEETINDLHRFLGYKAGVLTVDDINFSTRIYELIREENVYVDKG